MHKPDFRRAELKLCLIRSLCVSLFLLICFLCVHLVDDTIWLASLGATTFIAFAFPKAESVKNRVLLGGYFSACVSGIAISYLSNLFQSSYTTTILLCVLSVFLTTLSMTIFDFEHPPSAALAIGLVLANDPIKVSIVALLCVCFLCIIKMPLARLVLKEEENKQPPKTK